MATPMHALEVVVGGTSQNASPIPPAGSLPPYNAPAATPSVALPSAAPLPGSAPAPIAPPPAAPVPAPVPPRPAPRPLPAASAASRAHDPYDPYIDHATAVEIHTALNQMSPEDQAGFLANFGVERVTHLRVSDVAAARAFIAGPSVNQIPF